MNVAPRVQAGLGLDISGWDEVRAPYIAKNCVISYIYMTIKLPHAQGFSAYFIQLFAAMALFTFFFIDIEVETQEKKMTFTQEFSWVNKQTKPANNYK